METRGFWQLGHVSDAGLSRGLNELCASSCRIEARVVAHLAEVERRRLYLKDGFSSLFKYCTRQLGLSQDACLLSHDRRANRTAFARDGTRARSTFASAGGVARRDLVSTLFTIRSSTRSARPSLRRALTPRWPDFDQIVRSQI